MLRKLLGHEVKPLKPSFSNFHLSVKAGPMGRAMESAMRELRILTPTMLQDIITLGGNSLNLFMERFINPTFGVDLTKIHLGGYKPLLGKLALFGDKEGKTRVVAIVDYWTQSCLRPYHDALMGILRGLSTDCTFDQGSFKRILTFPGPYYSLDLKAVTDRMPLWLEKAIMVEVFGSDKADSWARLLVGRDYVSHGKSYRYAVGQPMGAYSS